MKFYLCFAFIFIYFSVLSQDKKRLTRDFGKITQSEYSMNSYSKDTIAPAVVLFESGKNTFEVIDRYVKLIKVVHKRIKIFDAKNYKQTEISIPYYHTKGSSEKVIEIKAVTHNGMIKKNLNTEGVYDVDISNHWSEKRFTLPDIQDGSIIEYTYKIVTPYFFNFGNWEFQGTIPKIYSEFSADIPGNYVYNRSIIGIKDLDVKEVNLKPNCFEVLGLGSADCDSSIYAMYDIPSYKNEAYMLAKENYISKLNYQLTETTSFEGVKSKYAKTWKDVDDEFKKEKDMGRQLRYISYFKEIIPDTILSLENQKDRALGVYNFIKDHYVWDGEYRIFSEIRVKKAYENKKGNIAEINLSLINAMKAAGIESAIALSSTRNRKVPSSVFPVLTEFNYVLAYIKIGTETFLLDASDKNLSFGMVPFKALNLKARVMDFKKGSYWYPINPKVRNVSYVESKFLINNDLEITGSVKSVYAGYLGYNYRNLIDKEGNDIVNKESVDYSLYDEFIENIGNKEAPLIIKQTFESEVQEQSHEYYFYPFSLNTKFKKNPFLEEKRQFPVDFGYDYSTIYKVDFEIDDSFKIVNIPKNKTYSFDNDNISCRVMFSLNGNTLQSDFRFKLKKTSFSVLEYQDLREIFKQIISLNNNTVIKLVKK